MYDNSSMIQNVCLTLLSHRSLPPTGEPNSLVVAHLDHRTGELTASISTQHDHYYIEPSRHHISVSHDFHMISYRASDMKYNLTRYRGCCMKTKNVVS